MGQKFFLLFNFSKKTYDSINIFFQFFFWIFIVTNVKSHIQSKTIWKLIDKVYWRVCFVAQVLETFFNSSVWPQISRGQLKSHEAKCLELHVYNESKFLQLVLLTMLTVKSFSPVNYRMLVRSLTTSCSQAFLLHFLFVKTT